MPKMTHINEGIFLLSSVESKGNSMINKIMRENSKSTF